MKQIARTVLIIVSVFVTGVLLVLGGMYIGRSLWGMAAFWPRAIMGGNDTLSPGLTGSQFNYQMGPGMMRTYEQIDSDSPYDSLGMMGGSGMMGSGMMSSGMMGGIGTSGLFEVNPLSLADAQFAVQEYLTGLDNADLEIGEVMIFDNHAYAQIVERSTGIGAMEVLVDPVTKAVFPEHGANMMGNLKYSPMSGSGMMGMMSSFANLSHGMMGSSPGNQRPEDVSADMPVSPVQAVTTAQNYLDTYLPGAESDDHADTFYGYYTLHILRDGEIVGMLIVNGFSRQVLLHTRHGDFLEMIEGHHDYGWWINEWIWRVRNLWPDWRNPKSGHNDRINCRRCGADRLVGTQGKR